MAVPPSRPIFMFIQFYRIISINNSLAHLCNVSLLAIIDKYGVSISQWTWLYQAFLEVSMNKIALWIYVCADDWTSERAIIASNATLGNTGSATAGCSRTAIHCRIVKYLKTPITNKNFCLNISHEGFVLLRVRKINCSNSYFVLWLFDSSFGCKCKCKHSLCLQTVLTSISLLT